MPFKVAIMGASLHTPNRGVSALGAALATLIWQSRPDATVSLLIANRTRQAAAVSVDGVSRSVRTVNYRLSPRAALGEQLWWIVLMSALYRIVPSKRIRRWIGRRSAWISAVVEADFIGDIRGGDSFSDVYGSRNFVLGCLPVLSVIWLRSGIELLPQTFGPFRSKASEWFARYILLRANSIWCRDRVSVEEVSRLTAGRRTGTLCPDVAFALNGIRPASLATDTPLQKGPGDTVIGLNVSGLLYYGAYTKSNRFGLKLDYRTFVKRLMEELLADHSNRILLVPHTFGLPGRVESDPAACREVKQSLAASLQDRVDLITREYDQHEIKGAIGVCDFFIGSRMHACIAALSQGIPTVGVAYSRKFAGVFELVGSKDWVIDGRTEDTQAALFRIQELLRERRAWRATLKAKVLAAQGDLSWTFAHLLGASTFSGANRAEECRSSVVAES